MNMKIQASDPYNKLDTREDISYEDNDEGMEKGNKTSSPDPYFQTRGNNSTLAETKFIGNQTQLSGGKYPWILDTTQGATEENSLDAENLLQFNKELQWTLVLLKKENESLSQKMDVIQEEKHSKTVKRVQRRQPHTDFQVNGESRNGIRTSSGSPDLRQIAINGQNQSMPNELTGAFEEKLSTIQYNEEEVGSSFDSEGGQAPPPRSPPNQSYMQPNDRKQIVNLNTNLEKFQQSLPDPMEVQSIIDQTKKTHKKVMVTKGRMDADKEARQQDDSEEDVTQIRPMRKQQEIDNQVLTKYHNDYIKNVVKNVNLAMNYRPGIDEKPDFVFKGDPAYNSKVKADLLSRTEPVSQKSSKKVTIEVSQDEEEQADEFDNHGHKKPKYVKKVTSVPEKYLAPARPGEDIDHNLQFISSIQRGQVQENPDYSFANYGNKNTNSHIANQKLHIEGKSTSMYSTQMEELLGKKAASKLTSLKSVIADYSTYAVEQQEADQDHVEELRDAAYQAIKWSYLGSGNPANKKKPMRGELVERYGAFSIDLGLNNEMDTDLNMSEAGKIRRKALYQADDAKKAFENFSKKCRGETHGAQEQNLTLKLDILKN